MGQLPMIDGPVTWDEPIPAPPPAVSHHGRELFALYAALLFIAVGVLVESAWFLVALLGRLTAGCGG